MDTESVFTAFKETLPSNTGVRVFLADYDSDAQRVGFGVGMNHAQHSFLRTSEPILIIGLTEKSVLDERGFKSLFALSCVRYLELPFTRDEFQQAAESVRGVKVSKADLEGVRQTVTENVLEEISTNVSHKLCGITLIRLTAAVRECRNLARKARSPIHASGNLTDATATIASLDNKVQAALATLDMKINTLGGICSTEISRELHKQRNRLGGAVGNFIQFTEGITVWTLGELEPESIEQLVNIGEKAAREIEETVRALTLLAGQKRNL